MCNDVVFFFLWPGIFFCACVSCDACFFCVLKLAACNCLKVTFHGSYIDLCRVRQLGNRGEFSSGKAKQIDITQHIKEYDSASKTT